MVLGLYRLYQIIGAILVITSVLIAYGILPNPIPSTPFEPSGIVAITHVNVIPMSAQNDDDDDERVIPNQTVLVRDGRIALMRASDDVSIPERARVIDGTGQYLIPGLIDSHVYLQSEQMIENIGLEFGHLIVAHDQCLAPYLAHGVTSVRVMSAVPEHVELAERVAIGNTLGPRMATSMGVVQSQRSYEGPYDQLVENVREAREAARLAAEEGFDRINFTSPLSAEAVNALLDEAGKVNIPVDGNLLLGVDEPLDVLSQGLDGIYGIYGLAEPMGEIDPELLQNLLMNDIHATSVLWIFTQLIERVELSGAERRELEDRYTCPIFREYIWEYIESSAPDVPPDVLQQRLDFRNWLRGLTAQLNAAGVPIVAGSFSSLGRAIPGYSLHSELEELFESGLTPYDALRTATSTPAAVFDEFGDAGVIAPGKRGDLLLLNANPLDNISNTRDIAGVVVNGVWWSHEDLERRIDAAFESTENSENSGEGE